MLKILCGGKNNEGYGNTWKNGYYRLIKMDLAHCRYSVFQRRKRSVLYIRHMMVGVRFFDTARAYSDSEEKLGAAFDG
mgnify:CR=1 FL=1